jgi:hypothetical protein
MLIEDITERRPASSPAALPIPTYPSANSPVRAFGVFNEWWDEAACKSVFAQIHKLARSDPS